MIIEMHVTREGDAIWLSGTQRQGAMQQSAFFYLTPPKAAQLADALRKIVAGELYSVTIYEQKQYNKTTTKEPDNG